MPFRGSEVLFLKIISTVIPGVQKTLLKNLNMAISDIHIFGIQWLVKVAILFSSSEYYPLKNLIYHFSIFWLRLSVKNVTQKYVRIFYNILLLMELFNKKYNKK